MKKILFILAIGCGGFMSCQSGSEQAENEHSAMEGHAPSSGEVLANAEIDPVCEMVRDETWTDFTVSGTDTVWFCAATCKEAFEANPDRYTHP